MKKKRFGRIILFVLLIAVAAGFLSLYVQDHKEDWVSKEEALHIALKDAGTSEGRIYDVRSDLTFRDDRFVYEFQFTDHTAQYRYVVDAQTGKIVEKNKNLT